MARSARVLELLACPKCHGSPKKRAEALFCEHCDRSYPIVRDTPVMILDESSIFRLSDFTSEGTTTLDPRVAGLKVFLRKITPRISSNDFARENYARFARELKARTARPRVLVIGGGILGRGMEALAEDANIELVETDVSFGPRTRVICDAHDLPFGQRAFDGVVAQAVLEHVVDPGRCVAEIQRVLSPEGLVYAETPFIQQVHMGRYDFWRFTALGHRRLFRWFDEIDAGAVAGPGVALAWSLKYFLLSFATGRVSRLLLNAASGFSGFGFKTVDRLLLMKRPGVYDAASGYYFMGRLRTSPLDDRGIVAGYRGACDSAIGI